MAEKKTRSLFSCSSRKERQKEQREIERHIELMTAIENLTAAITALTVSVDAVVNGWNTGPTEVQVQAAADAVGAQNARLVALVTPPPTP